MQEIASTLPTLRKARRTLAAIAGQKAKQAARNGQEFDEMVMALEDEDARPSPEDIARLKEADREAVYTATYAETVADELESSVIDVLSSLKSSAESLAADALSDVDEYHRSAFGG